MSTLTEVYKSIDFLGKYALHNRLIENEDVMYAINSVMNLLGIEEYIQMETEFNPDELPYIHLDKLIEFAIETGVLHEPTSSERDQFDTAIMNCFMARPSELNNIFRELYKEEPTLATDFYYHMSMSSNYIRRERIAKNKVWKTETPYGEIDITINLSKPEKDPKEIEKEKLAVSVSYPTCLLCKENVGYAGRVNHPARHNHRIIPVTLDNENWYLQYSPYVYFNEHCIVLNGKHEPMKISEKTFARLLDFVEQFPHYFVGSNADLPIVGGSILSHDHFQGGRYNFALQKTNEIKKYSITKFPNTSISIMNWPVSVLRVKSTNKQEVYECCNEILHSWKNYSDESASIHAFTNDIPHNTITPIARVNEGQFEVDLVLRNNRTTEEFPFGIFHPHEYLHHIKQENIGLIEVMGLAVLPARLIQECERLKYYLLHPEEDIKGDVQLEKHYDWFFELKEKPYTIDTIDQFIEENIGLKFKEVLEHCGVFKQTKEGLENFEKFMQCFGVTEIN